MQTVIEIGVHLILEANSGQCAGLARYSDVERPDLGYNRSAEHYRHSTPELKQPLNSILQQLNKS
jgi:hypothetical protein